MQCSRAAQQLVLEARRGPGIVIVRHSNLLEAVQADGIVLVRRHSLLKRAPGGLIVHGRSSAKVQPRQKQMELKTYLNISLHFSSVLTYESAKTSRSTKYGHIAVMLLTALM